VLPNIILSDTLIMTAKFMKSLILIEKKVEYFPNRSKPRM